MAYAILGIASIGFLVWGHHMFVAGQSPAASLVFSLLSFIVAVPSAIKVFNWTATLYKGSIRFDAPMLYALGFVGLFTIGGLTGLFLASLSLDVHLTDTYFVVSHFHYIMVGGSVMAYFGALHFWWPKITGRLYPEVWARIAAVLHLHRLQPDLLPAVPARRARHAAALPRLPARVPGAATCCRRAARWCSPLGYLLPLVYLAWSLWHGARAGAEPVRRARARVADRARRRRRTTSTRRRGCPSASTTTTPSRRGRRSDRHARQRHERRRRSAGHARRADAADPRARRRRLRHVGLPRHRAAVLRRAAARLRLRPAALARRLRRGQPPHRRRARHAQHRAAADQQRAGRAGGRLGREPDAAPHGRRAARSRPPRSASRSSRSRAIEYRSEWHEQLFPGAGFALADVPAAPSCSSCSISS